MRTKTRTTTQLKPGMVIRLDFSTNQFKQVATVKPGPWPNTRDITFTDGTRNWFHLSTAWTVARSKTVRNATKARAALIPGHALADVLGLFGAYARAAVS